MSKRMGVACLFLLAGAFFFLNRASYKGFFADDDFCSLAWGRNAPAIEYFKTILSPKFQLNNFRPAAQFVYYLEGGAFGFDYTKYLAVIHLIHFFNVWLLWTLIRRLGTKALPAAAACAFFALNLGFFSAVWRHNYVFDVLCTTFCLLSTIFFIRRDWILSFIFYWLAYKSKEPAVMLPLVFACYELWLGERRWKVLIPFFAASLSFGLQGIFLNPNQGTAQYAFQFTAGALAQTSAYYAGRVFLVPYLGFAVLALPFILPNRRIWFGIAATVLFFVPMLFLPGRIENAYCYLPFTGLAIALAGLAEMGHPALIAAFFVLWAPFELHELRAARRERLTNDDEARVWVGAWNRYAVAPKPADAIIYTGSPIGFGRQGMEGAIQCTYRAFPLDIRTTDHPSLLPDKPRMAFLTWNSGARRLDIVEHAPGTHDAPFIDVTRGTPVWQLEEGWYGPEGEFRWIHPRATARLERPAEAQTFAMRLLSRPQATVQITLNGDALEPRPMTQSGWQTFEWHVPKEVSGEVETEIQINPGFRPAGDPRDLGVAVTAFGFK